jgi:hypothetical protein
MTDLVPAEHDRLAELEAIVEAGLETFVEVGRALLEIRDGRLYRQTHDTFEAYVRERFEISRRHADRTIEAARVADGLRPIGLKPANEAQARAMRPLVDLKGEKEGARVLRALRDRFGESGVSARKITETVNGRRYGEPWPKTIERLYDAKPVMNDVERKRQLAESVKQTVDDFILTIESTGSGLAEFLDERSSTKLAAYMTKGEIDDWAGKLREHVKVMRELADRLDVLSLGSTEQP